MIVRLAQEEDFSQWLLLWNGYQDFTKTIVDNTVTEITWSRFHDPAEPMYCVVAEQEKQLIGMLHYIRHRSCWTSEYDFYGQNLYVHENFRRQGVGTSLIEFFSSKAAEGRSSRAWWLSHRFNSAANHLYDRLAKKTGFIQYNKMLQTSDNQTLSTIANSNTEKMI